MKMKKSLHEISMVRLQQKQAGQDVPQHKKKPSKDQLKELQEELRSEKEAREKLEEEKSSWTKERNFWIAELNKTEELRRAESRFSEVLRCEELRKLNAEKDLERQRLLLDLEDARKRRDEVERKKLEIEASWREATERWALKTSRMLDALEEKSEEIQRLRRSAEELRKEAGARGGSEGGEGGGNPSERRKGWYWRFTGSGRTWRPRWCCMNAVGCSSEHRTCCMQENFSSENSQLRSYTGL